MELATYRSRALEWQPRRQSDPRFQFLVLGVLVAVLFLGLAMSSIDLPEKPRRQSVEVPERVARFVANKKSPQVAEQKKPEAPPPPPPPVKNDPPARVERERPVRDRQPLTEKQKKAREVAERSGLLALRQEVSGLVASGAQVRGVLSTNLETRVGVSTVAGHDASQLVAGTATSSGGVDGTRFQVESTGTGAGERDLGSSIGEFAALDSAPQVESDQPSKFTERPAGGRSRESVSMVMDQNKGLLYSLYERERRRTLGLEGIVVIELTIEPDGRVSDAKLISSELNNPSLEQRLLARIKTLSFGKLDSPPLTVKFPIEFLPS